MTITEFLLARIEEDEDAARGVNRLLWNSRVALLDHDLYGLVSRHHPDRVLAECRAKRAIVELYDDSLKEQIERRDASALGAGLMLDDVIRALAAVHVDHPDYRKEWRV